MRGHGLAHEGAAHYSRLCVKCDYLYGHRPDWDKGRSGHGTSGEGHALCACGAMSEHLPSGNARKAWHREHKTAERFDL